MCGTNLADNYGPGHFILLQWAVELIEHRKSPHTDSVQIVEESLKQVAAYAFMQCSVEAYIDANIGVGKVCRFTGYNNK